MARTEARETRSALPIPKSRLGVGIIGVSPARGWATTAHIPALRALPNYEIRALSAHSAESARAVGEAFGVDEATEIGVVSHRAPPGRLEDTLAGIVAALLAKPAGALRATQRLLRHGSREEILGRMQLEGEVFAERLASAEAKAAINAFFEKRKPGSAA